MWWRGEVWRHITMVAKFLDHNNSELKVTLHETIRNDDF